MLKRIVFIVLLCAGFALRGKGDTLSIDTNSFTTILQLKDQNEREKKLIRYIENYLQERHGESLLPAKTELDELLLKNNTENRKAFEYFTESIYQRRLTHMDDAEAAMVKAIEYAGKNGDHFLTYTFLSHLAFFQTDEGNAIEAVTNYALAKKEALMLKDPHLQLQLDVNLSDVYYKNSFYNQSLFYLNEAETLSKKYAQNDIRVNTTIYYNKAENFFRMNKPDSLKSYCDKLEAINDNFDKLYTYRKRTEYYLYLLQYDFKNAVKLIKGLQKDSLYSYNDQDQQNLADAYFNGGQPDSAKIIINELLAEPLEINNPEVKYHLYKVLGEIAEGKKDQQQAAFNYKMLVQQSDDVISRLTQVGNISSQIKIDEIEGSYLQKDESYKRQRLWLIFAVVVALLTIAIITLSYRSARQRRHYQKLLFTSQKEELAFINSHEVRKHLSNILGIIDVVRHSEDKAKEYHQVENHLFESAKKMDEAIKNISSKLDDLASDNLPIPLNKEAQNVVPLYKYPGAKR